MPVSIDRSHAQEARRIFGQLYPRPAMSRVAATLLAESVAVASLEGANSWSVSLFEDAIRLNVGPVEVCTLDYERIKLVICIPEAAPPSKGLTLDQGDLPAYPSVPIRSGHLYLDVRNGHTIPREYIAAHHAYIGEAARRRRVSAFRRSFSVGVLSFLEGELNSKLPRPGYFDQPDAYERVLAEMEAVEQFDPLDKRDDRHHVLTSLVRRRGQARFRDELLRAYRGRCAITGCDVEDVLEAAHIMPYRGEHTNYACNGLLLRSDLHVIFDLHLLEIEADSYLVAIDQRLAHSPYAEFHGRQLCLPHEQADWPNKVALRERLVG